MSWPNQVLGSGMSSLQQAGQQAGQQTNKSNQRLRSFVERYVVARAGMFRADAAGHDEDMWRCMLDAKRVYFLIARMGRSAEAENDD